MFVLSRSPEKSPDKPTVVEIEFERGNPVAVNGKRMSPAALLTEMNRVGGENGIGRVDIVENRYVGMKSRGVYETPGGTILYAAHRAVESITMDREVMHIRDSLIPRCAEMVYYGFWYHAKMDALMAFIREAQQPVTGEVKLQLYKGNVLVAGRTSPNSLYDEGIATMEGGGSYNQTDAEGFLRIQGLPVRVQGRVTPRKY
jgi:argininosuccinate synthase